MTRTKITLAALGLLAIGYTAGASAPTANAATNTNYINTCAAELAKVAKSPNLSRTRSLSISRDVCRWIESNQPRVYWYAIVKSR